ncbi:Iwr1 domain-containing protein [Mycena chlorophos]|uniref:Probable RNA polymerase II nuclear localization protein SLC7A6OS n=1 Tax=Mycena chlorophos TaxID=658473 RepID=A0A8H6SER4_MYCCL|nr:Iwr1 domain-containing protein [Mycena chlorophos]
MDVDIVSPTYTILRIKRKRGEEPLDALLVEPEPEESSRRRKKSRGGAGVFQFAQTVEDDAWADERKKRDIQSPDWLLSLVWSPMSRWGTPSPLDPAQQAAKDEMQRRYKIILQEEQEQERGLKRRLPSSPPTVFSAKELAAAKAAKESGFTMYDAVLSADKPTTAAELDDEMEKFLPMLSEYLSVNDITLPTKTGAESLSSSTSSDDYVWDVFYHRPVTLSEWNAAANVATITGLPASLTDAYDSASDSEAEDEADEDSNAEEYYRNDYPDEEEDSSEESRSSDEFYDDSDDAEYVADDSDHEWR